MFGLMLGLEGRSMAAFLVMFLGGIGKQHIMFISWLSDGTGAAL